MKPTRPVLLAAALTVALGAAGCSSSNDTTTTGTASPGGTTAGTTAGSTPGTTTGNATGELTVSAAASLTASFKTIGDDFKKANPGVTNVTFNFGSSGTLATQITGGAVADNFASADQASMKTVSDAGLVKGSPEVFARNKLTIVVKKGNPKGIKTLADLTKLSGVVSLCATSAPCGKYADQILQKASVTIPADKVTRGQDVKATLSAVSDGDADAGIVYVTDVTGDKVEKVVIADADNAIAEYPMAVLTVSTNPSAAEAFMAYVLSPAGQKTLEANGFLPPT